MLLFFDTETTGVPRNYNAPLSDSANWPRLVQIGWVEYEPDGQKIGDYQFIVQPDGFEIPDSVVQIHHITSDVARLTGSPLKTVLCDFIKHAGAADTIIGHNIQYDICIVGAELLRCKMAPIGDVFNGKKLVCTMKSSIDFCKLPGMGNYKWPKLNELYGALFHEEMGAAHNALVDIQNAAKCYFELKRLGIIK